MPPRVAIPVPHSGDPAYAERALPQYEHAIVMAGGLPVRIPLDLPAEAASELIATCDAVLLPGSRADVDPAQYAQPRHAATADTDLPRDRADQLLMADADRNRKPILGICYGLQTLNVYRHGSLLQDIAGSLPEDKRGINHAIGRTMPKAHTVQVEPGSRLAEIVADGSGAGLEFVVNSSHHQSADKVGLGQRAVAWSPSDGVVEALEGTDPQHFVLAVQWHPERSVDDDEPSRAIFRALVAAAEEQTAHRS
jgi:putative glutamine amidotransferase